MLTVETELKESAGKGLGIFAVKKIKKGEIVWKYDRHLCKTYSVKEVEMMDPVAKAFIDKYAYIVPGAENIWELDLDNGRFMNHSDNPNTEYDNYKGWASRDIAAGEEITCNYKDFDIFPLDFLKEGEGI